MIRNILISAGTVLAGVLAFASVQAQTYSQPALMFSQTQFMGTARFQGIAGAGVALGGDIGNAYTNPAGLGFNRKSEFSFTPSFGYNMANASFNGGNKYSDNRGNAGLNSIGFTFSGTKDSGRAFKGGSFAISYNRTNDFNETYTYEGDNTESSIVDKLLYDADGVVLHDDLEAESQSGYFDLIGLAYNNYLINPVDTLRRNHSGTDYWLYDDAYSTFRFEPLRQRETVQQKGGQGTFNFAYGANFNDRVYVGATLGIHTLNYTLVKTYSEEAIEKIYEFDNLKLIDSVRIKGAGASFTVGVLFRPSNKVRVGFSVTTPTVYQVRDTYKASLETTFNADTLLSSDFTASPTETYAIIYDLPGRTHYAETNEIQSNYSIKTPFRLQAGASIFLGKAGFISGELEYVGYNSLYLGNADPYDLPLESENEYIRNTYNSALNMKVGAEFRISPLYVRGGLAYFGSPYAELGDLTFGRLQASAGVGLRNEKFFLDFTLIGARRSSDYSPYNWDTAPQISINQTKVRGVCSVGFFF